jgi:hypothetical protein
MEFFAILTIVSLLTTIGTAYYAFFRQPNKLKKLNIDIAEAANSKVSLLLTVGNLSKDKLRLESGYKKISEETDRLKNEWNKLSINISAGQQQLQAIVKDREQFQSDLSAIKSEIDKLKSTTESNILKIKVNTTDLANLTEQKKNLQNGIQTIQSEFQKLKKETTALSEQKLDLEKENSHLSLEIAKKKITYGTTLSKYNDTEGDKRPIKYIGYIPNNDFSNDCFPAVFMPQPNSVIKFPRKGRLGPRGYKEPAFEEELKTFFFRQRNLQLFIDRFLIISDKTRPYEPDFALIDEKENLNLFIDIEIDEPYDGIGRFATHYKGQDTYRNQYFNDRGWIVIRFSEKQVHENAKGCCRHIAEVIKSVNKNFSMAQELQNSPIVQEEPFWTKVKAERWAKGGYREEYLDGVSFADTFKVIPVTDNLIQNESEKEAERKVTSDKLEEEKLKGKYNELNRHHRDGRIKFFPKPHIYLIDENPRTISASTLVHRFFDDFDSETAILNLTPLNPMFGQPSDAIEKAWEDKRNKAASLGTQLHLDIEMYFENGTKPNNKREFDHFLDFYNSHLSHLKPYRTEWRIFDDLIYVAGTADMIFKKSDGTYAIYDWKRSERISMVGFRNKMGNGVCATLHDCNYNHYCIQLNIYKKILEDHYSKPVTEMYFVQLHPDQQKAVIFPVPDMKTTVDSMFNELTR